MNDLSPIAADQAAPLSPVHRPDARAARSSPPPSSSSRISNAASASTPRSCAPPWKRLSAPPTPRAPGTGRRPTTPARPRPSCSSANTARRCSAKPALRLRGFPPLAKIAGLLPTHTRRSEESEAFQQFSTPIPLGFAALTAAAIAPADRVLEPSAGTGLLAILAEIAGGALVLNELAETRAALLASLFPAVAVTRFDAAQIDDHLDPAVVPERRADEPAILGDGERRAAAWPTPPIAISPRRWRVSPTAGGWWRSPARTSGPTLRPGATPSSGCRSAAASSSPPRSTARSMPSTARRSRRG